jgi:outer membrane protein OmpA-like peptidoglycan-associated protein
LSVIIVFLKQKHTVKKPKSLEMKKITIFLTLMFFSIISVFAQDAEGCKDHPLFSRMPNYTIRECANNFGVTDLVMTDGNSKTIEGYKTTVTYDFNTEGEKQAYSFFQVVKNYENALAKYGVKRIYLASQYATLFCKSGGKSIWIGVEAASDVAESYTLTIMEIEEMKQDIQASAILDVLNKDGFIALDILFETGKSVIQKESLPIIDQIYEMLNLAANIKISIEGHTDNVGDATSNKKLSNDRAKSVMDVLIAKGIDKSRLSSIGWGQEKPVADNRTDEGKAKNRRVEIVKKP